MCRNDKTVLNLTVIMKNGFVFSACVKYIAFFWNQQNDLFLEVENKSTLIFL